MSRESYGDPVNVKNGRGQVIRACALSGVLMGDDFPVVWACREEEWQAALSEDRPPEGVPWPADDVQPIGGEDQ